MSDQYSNGPMFDMFVFETTQLLEQLEACILDAEKAGCYSRDAVNEIFRIMHTIKGSSGMMGYNGISSLAHSMEDLFYFLREENSGNVNSSELSDLLLADVDFIKMQIEKIKSGIAEDDDASKLIADNRAFLAKIRESDPARQSDSAGGRKYVNSFKAVIYFQEGCEMENIRPSMWSITSRMLHGKYVMCRKTSWTRRRQKSYVVTDLPYALRPTAHMWISIN